MPGIVLAFSAIPALMRLTRAGMIDALSSDYIRTARAKGLSTATIVLKHALRNAAMPVVSVAAVQLGFMLGGSIVIEAIFALHGVGYLAWELISKNDFPVVQAVVLLLAHHLHRSDAACRHDERGARSAAARGMRQCCRRASARLDRGVAGVCWWRSSRRISRRMIRSRRTLTCAWCRRSGWMAVRPCTRSAPISLAATICRG